MSHWSDADWWVQLFKDEYLPHCEDRDQGEEDIENVIERALESFESELKSALRDANEDYWNEPCITCSGSGHCDECEGTGTYVDDGERIECANCNRDGACPDCRGTGNAHPEKD